MCLGIDPPTAHEDLNIEDDQALNSIMLHLTIKHAGNEVTIFLNFESTSSSRTSEISKAYGT